MNKIAFLLPYYNHPFKIKQLINELMKFNLDIILINDGSSPENRALLDEVKGIVIVDLAKNSGKGAAMKAGFKKAFELGYTHVFQIDADFQHDLGAVGEFLSLSKRHTNAIISGNPVYGKDAPLLRLKGRRITDFWVLVNTLGGGLKDCMCGFRVYPLSDEFFKAVAKSRTNRMEFDIEILINAYRLGIKILYSDVAVRYDADGVSHFKMFRDNVLISLMQAKSFFSLPKYILKVLLYGR